MCVNVRVCARHACHFIVDWNQIYCRHSALFLYCVNGQHRIYFPMRYPVLYQDAAASWSWDYGLPQETVDMCGLCLPIIELVVT